MDLQTRVKTAARILFTKSPYSRQTIEMNQLLDFLGLSDTKVDISD